jgi:hypothetical protein
MTVTSCPPPPPSPHNPHIYSETPIFRSSRSLEGQLASCLPYGSQAPLVPPAQETERSSFPSDFRSFA